MQPADFSARHSSAARYAARAVALLLLAAACAGCAGLSATSPIASENDYSSVALDPRVTVFTTRQAVKSAKASPWFGTERAKQPSVAQVKLSSPYEQRAFSLASVGLGDWGIASVELLPNGLQWTGEGNRRDVLVYVHGFNQGFEQAVLDSARLADGVKFRGETILFTWPSKAALLDYIYDRDSAMWSRDALESMLTELLQHPAVNNIHIVAHSMGTMLSIEALRQLHARFGETAALKIGAVVLAAPDIDIDVFSSTVRRVGSLAQRITVLTATNDRALSIATKLAGGVTRVGAAEKERLEALGLKVIDASQFGGSGVNHDLFLSNERVRLQVRQAIEQSRRSPIAVRAGEALLGSP
ncbi:MAG: alpha/beta hydrolase [Bradyrhizobiaceae bacterium]|nr:alpha/beta hydrolase [Bradyrhizobiaceae bacterium]